MKLIEQVKGLSRSQTRRSPEGSHYQPGEGSHYQRVGIELPTTITGDLTPFKPFREIGACWNFLLHGSHGMWLRSRFSYTDHDHYQ